MHAHTTRAHMSCALLRNHPYGQPGKIKSLRNRASQSVMMQFDSYPSFLFRVFMWVRDFALCLLILIVLCVFFSYCPLPMFLLKTIIATFSEMVRKTVM